MDKRSEIREEYHEHPYFNGQRHKAIWVKTWASDNTCEEPPDDAPGSCATCGRSYGN